MGEEMIEIKFIKETRLRKIGDVVSISKKGGDNYVEQGYAEYVSEQPKNNPVTKVPKTEIKPMECDIKSFVTETKDKFKIGSEANKYPPGAIFPDPELVETIKKEVEKQTNTELKERNKLWQWYHDYKIYKCVAETNDKNWEIKIEEFIRLLKHVPSDARVLSIENKFKDNADIKNSDYTKLKKKSQNTKGKSNIIPANRGAIKISDSLKSKNNKLREQVLMALYFRDTGDATELLVDDFMQSNYLYTTRNDIKPEMWIYDEGIFVPNGIARIQEYVRQVMGDQYNRLFTTQIVEKIQTDTFVDEDSFFNANYDDLLPVANGILNTKTKELISYNPKYIFFSKLPVEYRPEAKCPNIMQFLRSIHPKEENVKLLCEIAGYCLRKKHDIHKWFLFFGNGRNGKSAFFRLLKSLLGPESISNMPLQVLEEERFSVANLHGKLANIGGDIPSKPLKTTAIIKAATGGDTLDADRKCQTRLRFLSYATQLHSANEIPNFEDSSDGFYMRLILIDFPMKFVSKKEYSLAEDKTHLGIMNPRIEEDITEPNELSGFLNLAIDSFQKVLENEEFSYGKGPAEVKRLCELKSDSVCGFFNDCCDRNIHEHVTLDDFREKYLYYCVENGIIPKTEKDLNNSMTQKLGCVRKRKMKPVVEYANGQEVMKRIYCWEGCKFKD